MPLTRKDNILQRTPEQSGHLDVADPWHSDLVHVQERGDGPAEERRQHRAQEGRGEGGDEHGQGGVVIPAAGSHTPVHNNHEDFGADQISGGTYLLPAIRLFGQFRSALYYYLPRCQ